MIVSMRGRETISTTSVDHLRELASKLQASGNKLMLCGVEEAVMKDLEAGEVIEVVGAEYIFPIQPVIGASIEEALAAAERWIAENKQGNDEMM